MTDRSPPVGQDTVEAALRERGASVGAVVIHCDMDGRSASGSSPRGDWTLDRLYSGKLFQTLLRAACGEWSGQDEPADAMLFPGCWAVPIPVMQRRRRVGYHVALLCTAEVLDAEQLHALCDAARLDLRVVRTLLMDVVLSGQDEVSRVGLSLRWTYRDLCVLADGEQESASFSCQLGEAYEELSLLYSLGQSMRIEQTPDGYIQLTCESLLQNLTFRFVAVRLIMGEETLRPIANELHIAGRPLCGDDELGRLTATVVGHLRRSKTQVILPYASDQDRWADPMGRCILAHPLLWEGKTVGAIIAGDKLGDDPDPTTGEIKLLDASAAYLNIFLENAALYRDQQALFLGTLEALTASIDAKDTYTCGHSQRVAWLSKQLAEAARFEAETVERIHITGVVHDIGKIGVPEAVLCKPGRLTKEEFDEIKKHPERGARILKDVPQLRDVIPGVLHHHERMDGKGYPHGLSGHDIPESARVIALADSFDAMSSTRTYRAAMSRDQVFEEIERCSGTQFDSHLVPCFLDLDFSIYDEMVRQHKAAHPVPAALQNATDVNEAAA
ncbi:MAG: HD domain-containing protein [Phycisphaerales bacterium]|nr:HD domain-containing protein [Phycisphaerales bacterium]